MPSKKKDWVLTSDALDRLLTFLDHDRDRAAEKYEGLRQMLIMFFDRRRVSSPEDQTDETINRVARRLSEGEEITASPNTYFYAVARNVWRELLAKPELIRSSIDELPRARLPADDPAALGDVMAARVKKERMLDCLEQCLSELPVDSSELLVSYYRGDKSARIKSRKELAERLGIPLNALRIRACRLRDKLEHCVRNCLQKFSED